MDVDLVNVPKSVTVLLKFKNPAPRPPQFRCSQVKFIDRMRFKSVPKGYSERVKLARLRKDGNLSIAYGLRFILNIKKITVS